MKQPEVSYPKVLVLSHNCFSKTGSNGRTLANFFIDWPKESLAQFYIIAEQPDAEICTNYFRITDIEVLRSYFIKKSVGSQIDVQNLRANSIPKDENLSKMHSRLRKRTPFHYIARNFMWDSHRWKNKMLYNWINEFNPSVLFLQLGDYAFMIRIAMDIAMKWNIPLIIFNCEDYYFKDQKSLSLLNYFYRFDYKRQVKKLYELASYTIYNSDMLQNTYQNEFKRTSTVIMSSTNITPIMEKKENLPLTFSYLGNVDLGRHEPLIEIAETLHHLNASLYLDVYGKVRDPEVKEALLKCSGMRYKGFVSYEKVIEVMHKTDVLVHSENFSAYYQWYLKHAFSTKIADCLGSGACLFIYAPDHMAFAKYLIENQAAFVVTDKKALKESMQRLIMDNELRQAIIKKALEVSRINHDGIANANKFRKIVSQVVKA